MKVANKTKTCPRCRGMCFTLIKKIKKDGTIDITGTERCKVCFGVGTIKTDNDGM